MSAVQPSPALQDSPWITEADTETVSRPSIQTFAEFLETGWQSNVVGRSDGDTGRLFNVQENATGYVVELVWRKSTPFSERLELNVMHPPEYLVAPFKISKRLVSSTGSSPVRIALPIEAFRQPGTEHAFWVVAANATVGLAVAQPYVVFIAEFRGIPFDPEFSPSKWLDQSAPT